MNFEIKQPSPVLQFRSNPGSRRRTERFIVHHSGGGASLFPIPVQEIHRWHLANGWVGIGYHIYIQRNGTIWEGRPAEWIGAHTGQPVGTNATTFGICCEGNYDSVHREMPDVQFNALVWTLLHFRKRFGQLPISGHRDMMTTVCPGQYFPLNEVRRLQFRGEDNKQEDTDMTEAQVRALVTQMLQDTLTGQSTKPSPWAQAELAEAMNRGITDGTRPRGYATREETAIMAHRATKPTETK